MDPTRRRVLGGIGTIAAIATTSGCLGTLGGGGGSGEYDALYDRAPFYAWVPTPGAFGTDHVGFTTHSAANVRESADSVPDRIAERFRRSAATSTTQQLELGAESIDYVTSLGKQPPAERPYTLGRVVAGSFGVETVTSDLSSKGFRKGGSYGEYDLYRKAEPRPWSVAVTDGTAILVSEGTQSERRDRIETIVDVGSGDRKRYVESDDDFGTLAETLGGGFQVNGATDGPESREGNGMGQIPGQVAGGFRFGTEDDGALAMRMAVVFESASKASKSAVRDWLRETESEVPMSPRASFSTDGRVVTASRTLA